MALVLASHECYVLGGFLQDLRSARLQSIIRRLEKVSAQRNAVSRGSAVKIDTHHFLALQRRHRVPQRGETVLDVVPPLPLQRIVVCPLLRLATTTKTTTIENLVNKLEHKQQIQGGKTAVMARRDCSLLARAQRIGKGLEFADAGNIEENETFSGLPANSTGSCYCLPATNSCHRNHCHPAR